MKTQLQVGLINRGWAFLEKVSKGKVHRDIRAWPFFQASQAEHVSDDIMTRNFWSHVNVVIKCTPKVFTFLPKFT